MSNVLEVKVPDIGDFKNIPVIEVLVKPGDRIDAETPLVTLESDKATMEVPAPQSGTVKDIKLKVGDKVSEGTLVLTLEAGEAAPQSAAAPAAPVAPAPAPAKQAPAPPPAQEAQSPRPAPPPTATLEPVEPSHGKLAHASPS